MIKRIFYSPYQGRIGFGLSWPEIICVFLALPYRRSNSIMMFCRSSGFVARTISSSAPRPRALRTSLTNMCPLRAQEEHCHGSRGLFALSKERSLAAIAASLWVRAARSRLGVEKSTKLDLAVALVFHGFVQAEGICRILPHIGIATPEHRRAIRPCGYRGSAMASL